MTITYSEVIERCKMLTAFENRERTDGEGDSQFEENVITAQDEPLLKDYFGSATLDIEEALARLVTASTIDTTGYTVDLRLSYRWNGDRQALAKYIEEAIVAYCMRNWYETHWPEKVPVYQTLYDETLHRIVTNAFRRRAPLKRPNMALSPNITLVEDEGD